ncbi:hypothetical protein L6452_01267 [Arctium lappa]|uniref:Uncharacterized protein n=1 Tax=Arctium lappa TaxID=4217 RepID=A0ACB9FG84_ARCLA|nr:hypothetical protein L6452_01267 [Arctium lappa]
MSKPRSVYLVDYTCTKLRSLAVFRSPRSWNTSRQKSLVANPTKSLVGVDRLCCRLSLLFAHCCSPVPPLAVVPSPMRPLSSLFTESTRPKFVLLECGGLENMGDGVEKTNEKLVEVQNVGGNKH